MSKSHETLDALSLSHLRALDAMLQEQSVTRAAERLGITQSAVSHTLRALRDALDDELFVRAGAQMIPTVRAESLALPLRRALNDLAAALSSPVAFDPATAKMTFTLTMEDAFALTLLPHLLEIVRAEAPGIDLDVRPPMLGRHGGHVESGDADLALIVGVPSIPMLRTRSIGTFDYACIVREDHPAVGDTLDLDTYCALPHALISPTGGGLGIVDKLLAELGRQRRVQLRIRFFAATPIVIARSDLILTGPRALFEEFVDTYPIRMLAPPVEMPSFSIRIAWHARVQDDPAHRWLRDACRRAIAPQS